MKAYSRDLRSKVIEAYEKGDGSFSLTGVIAALMVQGAVNSEVIKAFVQQLLVPVLHKGDVVLMDNLPVHKVQGVAAAIASAGATLRFLLA